MRPERGTGKRNKGRPKRMVMDVVKANMWVVFIAAGCHVQERVTVATLQPRVYSGKSREKNVNAV